MQNELQSRINAVNLTYRKTKQAIIIFQETPIVQTRKGLIRKMSTVDYIGVCKGKGIAFDAKMCGSKTSIPLQDFQEHQLLFLEYWEAARGRAFFLVHFYNIHPDSAYITPVKLVGNYFKKNERKSIPVDIFTKYPLVPINDYLCLLSKSTTI
jgi:recombination protein U